MEAKHTDKCELANKRVFFSSVPSRLLRKQISPRKEKKYLSKMKKSIQIIKQGKNRADKGIALCTEKRRGEQEANDIFSDEVFQLKS